MFVDDRPSVGELVRLHRTSTTRTRFFVNRTKDEIKNAPEFDDSLLRERPYRDQLGSYYGPGGAGFRDWDDV